MNELDEVLAEAEEILARPEDHVFQPALMLKLLVAMAHEMRQLRESTSVGDG
jgi:hypothetical protein